METMSQLFDQYDSMLKCAVEYADCFDKNKDDPQLSKLYQEMANAQLLNSQKMYTILVEKASEDISPEEAKRILDMLWEDRKSKMSMDLAKVKTRLGMMK